MVIVTEVFTGLIRTIEDTEQAKNTGEVKNTGT
jgi:hypothetical protein